MSTSCEMSDSHSNSVEKILFEAASLSVDVLVTDSNCLQVPQCRLGGLDGEPEYIDLVVPTKYALSCHSTIDCRFTAIDTPYFFQTQVVEKRNNGPAYDTYRIKRPDTIEPDNRRVYFRIRPSDEYPVWVRFQHAQKGTFRVLVEDISAGGVRLIMPDSLKWEQMHDPLSCILFLPDQSKIYMDISPRHKRSLLGVVHIGAEIVSIDEADRGRIIDYVNERMKHQSAAAGATPDDNVRLAVIEPASRKQLYSALKDHYTINRAWQAQNIAKLQAYLPDLIVLDMDHPDALTCLNSINATPALRTRPLVIVGKKRRGFLDFGGGTRYLSHPIDHRQLSRAIDQLIKEYRITCKVAGMPVQSWQTITVAMVRLNGAQDDTHVNYLERHQCQIVVVDSQKRIIPELTQNAPECIVMEVDDRNIATAVCRLIAFNKRLKHCPKILLTRDAGLGRQLMSEGVITGYLETPWTCEALLSAVYHSMGSEFGVQKEVRQEQGIG